MLFESYPHQTWLFMIGALSVSVPSDESLQGNAGLREQMVFCFNRVLSLSFKMSSIVPSTSMGGR